MTTLLFALAAAQADVVRHAIVVGSNDGGPGLEALHYAEDDARRVADLLVELGDVEPHMITVLRAPSATDLDAALASHRSIARELDDDLFIFYYSGHADARGLRMGDDIKGFSDLREDIRAFDANVKLGILDSCRSGEITRLKGLEVTAPFIEDEELQAEGEAWLTATAADEAAQESDRIQGSFFTHYLLSALRGAADQGDGQVSLGEAYAYVYDRTVVRTGATDAGIQHPGYDFRIQGQGDLILTDVSKASAQVVLPGTMEGELIVLRLPDRTPVAEVGKLYGVEGVLAIPPGTYELRLTNGTGLHEARIGLSEGAVLTVPELETAPVELAQAKGPGGGSADPPPIDLQGATQQLGSEAGAAIIGIRRLGEAWTRAALNGTRVKDELRQVQVEAAVQQLEPDDSTPVLWTADATPIVGCADQGASCLRDVLADEVVPDGAFLASNADGSPAARGVLNQGLPVGYWTFFHEDGSRACEGTYVQGKKAGSWSCWYPGGDLRMRANYEAGELWGTLQTWSEDGKKVQRIDMEAGEPNGRVTEWYPNGQKKHDGRLVGPVRVGSWTEWHDTGKRKAQGRYDGGVRSGNWTHWHTSGSRASQGPYRQGMPDGKWTTWYSDGQRESQGAYILGRRSGRWLEWHANGVLKSKGSFALDLPIGRYQEWFANGNKKARGHYRSGEKVGRWRVWDESGRVVRD